MIWIRVLLWLARMSMGGGEYDGICNQAGDDRPAE